MAKKILGVVAGYIVMVGFVFVTFSATYMILGTEGSYQPNSYEVSTLWIVASIILGLIGAILGGVTSLAIGKSLKATTTLAGLVLVLGLAMAIPTLGDVEEQSLVREGEVGLMEAMQSSHQPSWLAFLNPLLGAAGVVIGSRCPKKSVKQ